MKARIRSAGLRGEVEDPRGARPERGELRRARRHEAVRRLRLRRARRLHGRRLPPSAPALPDPLLRLPQHRHRQHQDQPSEKGKRVSSHAMSSLLMVWMQENFLTVSFVDFVC